MSVALRAPFSTAGANRRASSIVRTARRSHRYSHNSLSRCRQVPIAHAMDMGGSDGSEIPEPERDTNLAARKHMETKSSVGEFLKYMQQNEPHLFEEAVDSQILALSEAAEKETETASNSQSEELVLYKRMYEIKQQERARAVKDIIYVQVINRFSVLGVDLVRPDQLEGMVNLGAYDIKALTEGVHTKDALETVKNHLLTILGPALPQNEMGYFSNVIRISKLQAAQVYAASAMFGYFIRKADRRFQLEKAIGIFDNDREETVKILNSLFESDSLPDDKSDDEEKDEKPVKSLKDYIESFDQATLVETASILSIEAGNLLQEHTTAVFGNLQTLQQEMMDAIGDEPAGSAQELTQRLEEAVKQDKVQTMTISLADQRRVVLEAVAFGSFLHDSEAFVEQKATYPILTQAPKRQFPPGMIQ